MELSQAIHLISGFQARTAAPESWADLGCGAGLFTYALARLLPPGSRIYAVDKAPVALQAPEHPPPADIRPLRLDFIREPFPFPVLDGVLMANSLHFVPDQPPLLQKIKSALRPGGRLLLVEYDTDKPNPWVPFPLGFNRLKTLLEKQAFVAVEQLQTAPSRYGRAQLYGVVATWNGE